MEAFFADTKSFHIIAHSFGTLLALKFADILEGQGKLGQLSLIDGSPLLLKMAAMEMLPEGSPEVEVQNLILKHMMSLVIPNIPETANMEVLSLTSWEEKASKVVEMAAKEHAYSKDYLAKFLNGIVNRNFMMAQIDPDAKQKLNSKSLLMRSTKPMILDIIEDYGLSSNFKEKLELVFVEGDHLSMLESPVLVEVLNKIHSSMGS